MSKLIESLRSLLRPIRSDFMLIGLDHNRGMVIAQDPQLGLNIEVPIAPGHLLGVRIIGPYSLELTYRGGTVLTVPILV